MIDFDITQIKNEIKDLSYADKLAYLENKESIFESEVEELESEKEELESKIDELEDCIYDISSLKNEIETNLNDVICKSILQSLEDAGHNFKLDYHGNIHFSLGKADFTILMSFKYDSKVEFFFISDKKQHTFQDLICSIMPDFKKDINRFSRQVPEEEISKCVVDVVSKLMNNKQKFEEVI